MQKKLNREGKSQHEMGYLNCYLFIQNAPFHEGTRPNTRWIQWTVTSGWAGAVMLRYHGCFHVTHFYNSCFRLEMTLSHILMFLTCVQPWALWLFKILRPRHRNFPSFSGATLQYLTWFSSLQYLSERSSHKTVQTAESSQTDSFEPTNWYEDGAFVLSFWAGWKDTWKKKTTLSYENHLHGHVLNSLGFLQAYVFMSSCNVCRL